MWQHPLKCFSMANIIIAVLGLAFIVPTSSSSGVASEQFRTQGKRRDLYEPPRNMSTIGPDGSCHLSVATEPRNVLDTVRGQGIIFAIQSDDSDDDGLQITSFGFHIDSSAVEKAKSIDYEVYALEEFGYYASPNRDKNAPGIVLGSAAGDIFDYRGKLDQWTMIATGEITSIDLEVNDDTLDGVTADFFQIPLGTFQAFVPGNGGLRSFYITTPNSASFIYASPNGELNDNISSYSSGNNFIEKEKENGNGENNGKDKENGADNENKGSPNKNKDVAKNAPKLLVGEGVVTYPMPDVGLMYQKKSFVGSVYYEDDCPTLAPSMSLGPSYAPTIPPSGSPSFSPTSTVVPSTAPSLAASSTPSSEPSSPPSFLPEKLYDGLLLELPIDCVEGEELSKDESSAVAESVQKMTADAAGDSIQNIAATVAAMFCKKKPQRRRLSEEIQSANHGRRKQRNLPVGSSAMEFSMVITGEYRALSGRPGESGSSMGVPDLGSLAQDSINRDPEKFVKNIQERAGESSRLQEVEASEIEVQAVELVEGETLERFTPSPTPRPTRMPIMALASSQESQEEGNHDILMICVVIVTAIIVVLGAFLVFRYGQRRAARKQRIAIEKKRSRRNMQGREGRDRDSNHTSSVRMEEGDAQLKPHELPDWAQYEAQMMVDGYQHQYGYDNPPRSLPPYVPSRIPEPSWIQAQHSNRSAREARDSREARSAHEARNAREARSARGPSRTRARAA
jgi:hypothetical protein